MRRRPGVLLLLAALALCGFEACGGGGSGKSCGKKVASRAAIAGAVTICASDIRFDVSTITAPPGPLKVTLENNGAIEHTFQIKGTPVELKANAGQSDSGTVTLSAGTYTFECTIPGHAQAGMKGKVVVG